MRLVTLFAVGLALLTAVAVMRSQEALATQAVIWALVCIPSLLSLLIRRRPEGYRAKACLTVVMGQVLLFLPMSVWMSVFPVRNMGLTLMVLPTFQLGLLILSVLVGILWQWLVKRRLSTRH